MPEFSTETATTVSIAQTLLVAEKDKGPITAALISQKVKIAASVVAPGNEQSIDTSAAIAELIRRFSMWIGQDTAMSDTTGHLAWLGAARKKDWRYWPRYRRHAGAHDVFHRCRCIGSIHRPHPGDDGRPRPRRSVGPARPASYGPCQSGKTANYSGLICKAADSGYKIIIILAGLHNNLRSPRPKSAWKRAFLAMELFGDGRHRQAYWRWRAWPRFRNQAQLRDQQNQHG